MRNFLEADLVSGAELVLKTVKFDEYLQNADLVITGEGCSDGQTVCGKLPAVVAEHAAKANVPAVLVSGALGRDSEKLQDIFAAVFSLTDKPCTLDEAIKNTSTNLKRIAKSIASLLVTAKKQ